jgi:hypothetical protein
VTIFLGITASLRNEWIEGKGISLSPFRINVWIWRIKCFPSRDSSVRIARPVLNSKISALSGKVDIFLCQKQAHVDHKHWDFWSLWSRDIWWERTVHYWSGKVTLTSHGFLTYSCRPKAILRSNRNRPNKPLFIPPCALHVVLILLMHHNQKIVRIRTYGTPCIIRLLSRRTLHQ